jgi:hypothetical protein
MGSSPQLLGGRRTGAVPQVTSPIQYCKLFLPGLFSHRPTEFRPGEASVESPKRVPFASCSVLAGWLMTGRVTVTWVLCDDLG